MARTDLMSFGGTTVALWERGCADSSAGWSEERGTARFAAAGVIADFSSNAGAMTVRSFETEDSFAAGAEGFAASEDTGCDGPVEAVTR